MTSGQNGAKHPTLASLQPTVLLPPFPGFPKQEAVAKTGKAAPPVSKKPEPAVPSAGVAAAATTNPAIGGAAAAAVAMAKAVVAAVTTTEAAAAAAPGAKAAATASNPSSVVAPPPSVQVPPSVAVLKPAGTVKSSALEVPKALASAGGKGGGAGDLTSYEMSDHDGSSSESESDEESAQERKRRMGKKVRLRRVVAWLQALFFLCIVPRSPICASRGTGVVVVQTWYRCI